MAIEGLGSGSNGVAFLVSAGVVYEIMAAACSSPQTAELNAKKRAPTLMKWVHIGLAQSILFIGLAMLFDPKMAKPILVGGGLGGTLMYSQYWYARACGLNSDEEGTEQY